MTTMTTMKYLGSFLLVLAVLFAQVGSVAAAPQTQDGTIIVSGKVTEIGEPQTDGTVLVTVMGADETETTVRVSAEVAGDLAVGDDVNLTVNADDVIPDEEPAEADVHPISEMLAGFFFDGDQDMAILIDGYHSGDNDAEQVFGFGVIAQALWMARDAKGETDAELAGAILQAKKSGDYQEVARLLNLTDPDSVPTNWGQLKKTLKNHNSVGQAKPSQANDDDSLNTQQDTGKNKDKGKDKGNDNPGKGNSKDNPGKGKDKGNGKP